GRTLRGIQRAVREPRFLSRELGDADRAVAHGDDHVQHVSGHAVRRRGEAPALHGGAGRLRHVSPDRGAARALAGGCGPRGRRLVRLPPAERRCLLPRLEAVRVGQSPGNARVARAAVGWSSWVPETHEETHTMAKRVADGLVETLAAHGVERIYGVAGDSLNGITDSIRERKSMRWLHVRHEEAAAFAAGAEAHLTGKLAVCAGSCGPGNLHLINGLYDCHRSRVPVLAIAAQIPSHEIGTGYFQETDPGHLFAQCSHYYGLVSQPDHMPRLLEIAMQTALSRRGVAVLGIPGDIALRDAAESKPGRVLQEPSFT